MNNNLTVINNSLCSMGLIFLNDYPIQFFHDKVKDEICIVADDFAKSFGFDDFAQLLTSDSFLDSTNILREEGQIVTTKEMQNQEGKKVKFLIYSNKE